MKNLLARFLLRKSALKPKETLDEIEQWLSLRPNFVRAIRSKELMTDEQLFNILLSRSEEGLSFADACRQEGVVLEDFDELARLVDGPVEIPLFKMLIDSGQLDPSEAARLLDEFQNTLGKTDNGATDIGGLAEQVAPVSIFTNPEPTDRDVLAVIGAVRLLGIGPLDEELVLLAGRVDRLDLKAALKVLGDVREWRLNRAGDEIAATEIRDRIRGLAA